MIKNELEYNYSRELVEKFQKSIAAMDKDEAAQKNDPERWKINRDVLQYHLMGIQAEVDEYERLINSDCKLSQPIDIKVESLTALTEALIKARIAAKMSEKELADILGIDEEMVKKYEKTNYQSASFGDLIEFSTVLGLEFATAVVRVNFEQIEEMKKIAARWQKNKQLSQAAKL
jgi:transcriptional regulator with XRE-family HTH domain